MRGTDRCTVALGSAPWLALSPEFEEQADSPLEADGLESNYENGNSVLCTDHMQILEPLLVVHPLDLSVSPLYR